MQRTFSYILLITWVFLIFACKTHYTNIHADGLNIRLSDSIHRVDNQVVGVYMPYKKILDKDMLKVIAVTEEEMVKEKPESNLTNFLADLLLEQGTKEAKSAGFKLTPDISYFNYGGIRTFLPEGEITVGKIYELIPFENKMVYLHLSGKQIQIFLNDIAEKGGDILGGVRFVIADQKAKNIIINGEPLNMESNYWLVTNDYVASGGDNLEILTKRNEFIESEKKIRDVIIAHLMAMHKKGKAISEKTDERIRYE